MMSQIGDCYEESLDLCVEYLKVSAAIVRRAVIIYHHQRGATPNETLIKQNRLLIWGFSGSLAELKTVCVTILGCEIT